MKYLISFLLYAWACTATAQTASEYAYGPDPQQRLDVYEPSGPSNGQVIVMLHGGGWHTGDKANRRVWQAKVSHWGPDGTLFVSVNTRLMPQADPVTQARDLASAMGFVQRNAAQWGADGGEIILMGHSAGAHVAALLTARADLRQAEALVPWRGTILLDSASLDVPHMMQTSASRLHRRAFGNDPDDWRAADPTSHVGADAGPLLIVCSTQRRVACEDSRRFGNAAAAQGNPVTILPVALSHRDINASLGQPNSYTQAVDAWIDALP